MDSTRGDLARGYQGSDGAQFGQLLEKWDQQCGVIQKNLRDMIDKLGVSLQEHTKTQAASHDKVMHATHASQAAFDALSGA
ncbi:hypothetical protein [Streptomyces sp. NPDC020996]|uniref:hypothetical protein n=1 Tax=Streptomyces sp. NPDC020996 TaxID=3154791 RepID=UPI003405E472